MARFEFQADPPSDDWVDRGSRTLSLFIRLCGLVLMLVGFVVALMVIVNAWSLYDDPDQIKRIARAVERGSNLDSSLSSAAASGRRQLDNAAGGVQQYDEAGVVNGLRFSYFVAWMIAILLLLLIGQLSISAVRTGGELALYDVKVGKLARALLQERARSSSV